MTRTILPPLLALVLGASLYAGPTRAAEPAQSAPFGQVVDLDPIARVLTLFQPNAIFVGRSRGGLGYVLLSPKRAFWVRLAPGGIVRLETADPVKVKAIVRRQGWTI